MVAHTVALTTSLVQLDIDILVVSTSNVEKLVERSLKARPALSRSAVRSEDRKAFGFGQPSVFATEDTEDHDAVANDPPPLGD